MAKPLTFEQLDDMTAEALPERTVLSTIVTPVGGGGAIDGGGGSIAMNSCSTTVTQAPNPGLLGLLLPLTANASSGPITTTVCVPGMIAS